MDDQGPSDLDDVVKPRANNLSLLHLRALILHWRNPSDGKKRSQKQLATALTDWGASGNLISYKTVSDWENFTSFPRDLLDNLGAVLYDDAIGGRAESSNRLAPEQWQELKAFADDLVLKSTDTKIQRYLRAYKIAPVDTHFSEYLADGQTRLIDPMKSFMPRGISGEQWAEIYNPPPIRYRGDMNETDLKILLNRESRSFVSIIGPAGQGKSTLLRYLRCATWHWPEDIGLKEAHFPFFIPAQTFETVDSMLMSIKDPVALLVEAFKRAHPPGSWTASDVMIQEVLQSPDIPCLVLVDGFNEVSHGIRSKLASKLWKLHKTLFKQGARVGVIVSSRQEIVPDFERIGSVLELMPLAQDYYTRLTELWAGKGATKFENILNTPERAAIGRFIKDNPLVLALALSYFCDNEETLPTNMQDFFEHYFCTTFGASIAHSEGTWEVKKYVNSVLGHIAFEQLMKRADLMTEPFIRNAAKGFFLHQPECESNRLLAITHASAFFEFVSTGTTALYKSIADKGSLDNLPVSFQWVHDLLRDYLAACVLHDQPSLLVELLRHSDQDGFERWLVPFAFALQMLPEAQRTQVIPQIVESRGGVFALLQYLGYGGKADKESLNAISQRLVQEIKTEEHLDLTNRCLDVFTMTLSKTFNQAAHIKDIRIHIENIIEDPDLKPEFRSFLKQKLLEIDD